MWFIFWQLQKNYLLQDSSIENLTSMWTFSAGLKLECLRPWLIDLESCVWIIYSEASSLTHDNLVQRRPRNFTFFFVFGFIFVQLMRTWLYWLKKLRVKVALLCQHTRYSIGQILAGNFSGLADVLLGSHLNPWIFKRRRGNPPLTLFLFIFSSCLWQVCVSYCWLSCQLIFR